MTFVGKSVPRTDGVAKVLGKAQYVDDIKLPGMWHGALLRSSIPHGRVKKIEFDPTFDWSRVVVADQKDIPGKNCVAMIEDDLPLIACGVVKHVGEAILLIAAPSREEVIAARKHIDVEYEEFEPIFTIEESKRAKIRIRGEDNIVAEYSINKGDILEGFQSADEIVGGVYSMGHQEHMYIEPQGVIASFEGDVLKIIGSLQCPYYVSGAISVMMGVPSEKISVRQATIGGAFGGKEDYPSILACFAALLAKKSGHPVKMVYDREEDTEVTTKRHPAFVSLRMGVKKDGRITATEINFEMDAGAYTTLTPVVLSRGLIHAQGAYRHENIYARGIAYATNTPPNGAFRGFGAPQAFFPLEVHIDRAAKAIGMPPLEFRRKNCLRVGDTMATGQVLQEGVGAMKVLNEAARRSGFSKKYKNVSKNGSRGICRGIGMALFMHGSGFTGSGEAKLKGEASLRLDPDGKVAILTACTDMGQGVHTVLPQMTADFLDIDLANIRVETPDTALVPNSGPTVASRTTLIMGMVLKKCAARLKALLSEFALADGLEFSKVPFEDVVRKYLETKGPLTITDHYELPPHIKWDDAKYMGDAYPVYAWGCDVAEVLVDMDTFEVSVQKMWLVQDVGKAINPKMAVGQIEGGTLQSVGWALMESHALHCGHFRTNNFQTYIIPTALDVPEMETIIVEEPFSFGPMGAKGLGELPVAGSAPAIANAIVNATGICMTSLPMTPEKLYDEWKK